MAFGVPCWELARCTHKPDTRGWCGHWAERSISLFSLLHHMSSPWPLTAPVVFGGSCCRYLIENFPLCIGILGLRGLLYTYMQQYCMGFSLVCELAQREEPGFECSYKEMLNSPACHGCSPNTLTQPCSESCPLGQVAAHRACFACTPRRWAQFPAGIAGDEESSVCTALWVLIQRETPGLLCQTRHVWEIWFLHPSSFLRKPLW